MHESERVKLLGKYGSPRFKYGDVVTCAIRGKVKIVGLSNGRIPWPKCRSGKRARAIILYGALAEAVRRESVEAVKCWFGVGGFTVWKRRMALGVDRINEGTSALHSRWSPETVQSDEANARRAPTLHSPERAAKIAAANRGKSRPAHVIEAVRWANLGRKASAATRQKMSEAHRRRGTQPPAMKGPPWTPEEDALLGTMRDRDVADRIGRSEGAVADRRYVLDVSPFVKRKPRGQMVTWTLAKDRLLGTVSDSALARRLRCSPVIVFKRRRRLRIPPFRG